jgi:hypothetical protein
MIQSPNLVQKSEDMFDSLPLSTVLYLPELILFAEWTNTNLRFYLWNKRQGEIVLHLKILISWLTNSPSRLLSFHHSLVFKSACNWRLEVVGRNFLCNVTFSGTQCPVSFRSEMSYERKSDSQRLWSCGYTLKLVLTTQIMATDVHTVTRHCPF